ncbi:MAG: radical SAM protein, partial [Candidatus Methylomirabilia bacterium]
PLESAVVVPSLEELKANAARLLEATRLVEAEQSPLCGRRLVQFHGARAVVVEPPAPPLNEAELDNIYDLPFTRLPHPANTAPIPAFTMIRDSVTIVRGCAGGCSFCGLGLHQGKFIASRSEGSILREVGKIAADPGFRGTVSDLGGPSANLYGCRNGVDDACRACRRPSCLVPAICRHFKIAEEPAVGVLRKARGLPGVKHVFVQSGIRMDVALRTPKFLRELVRHHVSGHLKVAPEHLDPTVLRRMRKPGGVFEPFLEAFRKESAAAGKEQYLVPYFISSFPGCTQEQMRVVENYLHASRWNLQQVQDFIPLPMTPAAAMYVTGVDYETGAAIPVARGAGERQRQRSALGPSPRPRNPAPARQAARKGPGAKSASPESESSGND